MQNKKGFTLLELLIAAALIGVLAMFATQAYRASASEVRVADAAARANAVAMAARRFYAEYPAQAGSLRGKEIGAFLQPGECKPNVAAAQTLVDCGFLEYHQLTAETRKKTNDSYEYYGNFDMSFSADGYAVCFTGKGRVLDSTTYCYNGEKRI